jgi:hypothetical protein
MKRPLIIGISGIAIIIVAWVYLRPAWMSEASIRASLLGQTPVGSNMDEVRALAEKRGWTEPTAQLDSYMHFPVGSTGVVVTAFGGRLWHDPFPYRTEVRAIWEFNESRRLYDIVVHRYGFE